MQYVYPAIIKPNAEFDDWFYAEFPDLGCSTENYGGGMYSIIVHATELLNRHMIKLEDAGEKIPAPTYIKDVKVADDEIVTLIKADTDAYKLFIAKCKNL